MKFWLVIITYCPISNVTSVNRTQYIGFDLRIIFPQSRTNGNNNTWKRVASCILINKLPQNASFLISNSFRRFYNSSLEKYIYKYKICIQILCLLRLKKMYFCKLWIIRRLDQFKHRKVTNVFNFITYFTV